MLKPHHSRFLATIDENLTNFQPFEDYLCVGYCKNYESALQSLLIKTRYSFFHFSDEIPLSLLYELKEFTEYSPYVIGIHKERKWFTQL